MKPVTFRKLVMMVVGLVLVHTASAATPGKPPNILWLTAEDIGPDLHCYGDPDSLTPNLDKLASQGRLYRNAFSTAPVCSASRSAFCTGVYQTSFGAQHHRSHRDDDFHLPEGVRLVFDRMHDAGYSTALVHALPEKLGFSTSGKTDWNFVPDHKPAEFGNWQALKGHQPFFAQINFHETHRPYEKATVHPTDPAKVTLPPYLADVPIARKDWALYHDMISDLDTKVGAILDLLEQDGMAENTVVFFFGDHGRECFRGKYFSYEQGCHTSLMMRWPGKVPAGEKSDDLISLVDVTATSLSLAGVKLPEQNFHGMPFFGPGAKKRELVFTARDRIDDTVDRVRTVRDARFKYMRNFEPERPYLQPMAYAERTNPNFNLMKELFAAGKLNADQAKFLAPHRPAEELYDLQADPWEFHNLAAVPEHKQTLERLRGALDQWIKDTHDQGETPEDPETQRRILDEYKRLMDKQAANQAKAKAPKSKAK